MPEIETVNEFIVVAQGESLVIMNPPRGPITKRDALLLAAYLVLMAAPEPSEFGAVLQAVGNC